MNQRLRVPFASMLTGAIIGLVIGLFACAHAFDRFEAFATDLRLRLRGPRFAQPGIVTVGVQDACLDETHCGPLPWSRDKWARAVDILKKAGARVIAFDVFFSEPSVQENDALFRDAIRRAGNVVLPVFAPGELRDGNDGKPVFSVRTLQGNLPELEESAVSVGHINVSRDVDGICRSVPLLVEDGVRCIPHLSVEAVRRYLGPGVAPVVADGRLHLDGHAFDLIDGRLLPINFYRVQSRNVTAYFLPFHLLIEERFPPSFFRDKLVVIGQAAEGLKNADIVTTPFGEAYGLNLETEAMMTLLSGAGLRIWNRGQSVTFLVIVGALAGAAMGGKRLYRTLAWLPILLLAATVFALVLFVRQNTMIPFVPTIMVIGLCLPASLGIGHFHQSREAEEQRQALENLAEAEGYISELLSPKADEAHRTVIPGSERLAVDRQIARAAPDAVLYSLGRAIHARGGHIYLKDGNGQLVLAASYGDATVPDRPQEHTFYHALAEYHVRESRPIASFDPKAPAFVAVSSPFASVISIRLARGDEFVGFITFYAASQRRRRGRRPSHGFSAHNLVLAITMTPHVLVTLENARLHEQMQEQWLASTRTLVKAIEAKDPYTRGHSERVAAYSEMIARHLGLTEAERDIIHQAAILHDVGKIGIAEHILHKHTELTEDELNVIRTHPGRGVDIIQPMSQLSFLLDGIKHHHEQYDGSGYPYGLADDDIPLVARIIALGDAFDAMTSDRPYRHGMSPASAMEAILSQRGTQFDPVVADAFLAVAIDEGIVDQDLVVPRPPTAS